MSVSIDGTNGLTFSDATTQNTGGYTGFRNRIINGDMRIDQRNNGAAVTSTVNATYFLDRWRGIQNVNSKFSVQRNAGSVTPPSGFTNYLGVTSLSAYSVGAADAAAFGQAIEGFNVSDFAWGTASAQPITLSFRVRSSLTGLFAGAIQNASQTRSYPFTFSIPLANTWATVSIVIPGDTTGTWLTDNLAGLWLWFSLGAGANWQASPSAWGAGEKYGVSGQVNVIATNGATFYITGCQLEKGSVATPFEFRQYGTELALCQRYFVNYTNGFTHYSYTIQSSAAAYRALVINAPATMRASPTVSNVSYAGSASTAADSIVGSINGAYFQWNSIAEGSFVGVDRAYLSAEL